MLREHDAGVKTVELCHKHGISDATFYIFQAKFGGMTVSKAAQLRALEDENGRFGPGVRRLDVQVLLAKKTDPACTSLRGGEEARRRPRPLRASYLQAGRSKLVGLAIRTSSWR